MSSSVAMAPTRTGSNEGLDGFQRKSNISYKSSGSILDSDTYLYFPFELLPRIAGEATDTCCGMFHHRVFRGDGAPSFAIRW